MAHREIRIFLALFCHRIGEQAFSVINGVKSTIVGSPQRILLANQSISPILKNFGASRFLNFFPFIHVTTLIITSVGANTGSHGDS